MKGHRWPIRYQLAAILVVPLLALVVAGIRQGAEGLTWAGDADRVRTEARFAVAVNALIHEVQRERGLSGGYVGSQRRSGGPEVTAQRKHADSALAVFGEKAEQLPLGAVQEHVRASLGTARQALRGLAEHRRAIDSGNLDVTQTLAYYTDTINKLLAVNAGLVDASGDRQATQLATVFLHLSQAKELTGQERAFLNSAFSAGRFGPGGYNRLLTIIAAQNSWHTQFRAVATPEQLDRYDTTVAGRDVETAAEFRERALAEGGEGRALSVDSPDWWAAITMKIDLMREVELGLAGDLEARADDVAREARAAAIRDMVIAFLVVALSLALSLFTARRMARSLGRLRDAAHDTADRRLPAVVARLGKGEDVDVEGEAAPVRVDSQDEIGDTAYAFNRVHKVALELTVQQAGMRRNLGDTLLNLARRSQSLVHQQIDLIDDLERGEQDAKQLQALFRLDHLATRMRRHTEDLIVLSGAAPSRAFSHPVPLRDVIRGAVAEVEHYSRVRTSRAPDVTIRGHVVGDLVHLLAELIENATRFSPPQSPVQVSAGEVGNGYVIDVEDRGLGMAEAEISRYNERLADPPVFDLSTSDRIGLFVVGRLAARHGVRVRLRSSVYGGVTAVVLLHSELLDPTGTPALPTTTAATNPATTASPTASAGTSTTTAMAAVPAGIAPLGRGTLADTLADGTPEPARPGRHRLTIDGFRSTLADNPADNPADGTPEPARLGRHRLAVDRQPAEFTPSGRFRIPFAHRSDATDTPAPQTGPSAPVRHLRTPTGPVSPVVPVLPAVPVSATTPTSTAEDVPFRPSGSSSRPSEPPHRDMSDPDMSDAVAALGLPRRVPRQHLAHGLRRDSEAASTSSAGSAHSAPSAPSASSAHFRPTGEDRSRPSPEEIQKMLSGYQSGFDRGRENGHTHGRNHPHGM